MAGNFFLACMSTLAHITAFCLKGTIVWSWLLTSIC
jgi:hypothetical protein